MSTPLPQDHVEIKPDLPPAIAATALRKLIAFELKSAGFESAEKEALENLEGVVYSCKPAPVSPFTSLLHYSARPRVTAGRSR
jgi:hypothetical protein